MNKFFFFFGLAQDDGYAINIQYVCWNKTEHVDNAAYWYKSHHPV